MFPLLLVFGGATGSDPRLGVSFIDSIYSAKRLARPTHQPAHSPR